MRNQDGAPRELIVFTVATAGVVLIVVALALEAWWLLVPAVCAHALAATIALRYIGKRAAEGDEPDARARERVREEQSGHEDLRTQPERVADRSEQ